MHIHPNQMPVTEMNSLYAAGKAAARREVERTRNKLLAFGYDSDSESDAGEACLVDLNPEQEFEREKHPHGNLGRERKQSEAGPEGTHGSVSDWV